MTLHYLSRCIPQVFGLLIGIGLGAVIVSPAHGATIWNGPAITFTEAPGASGNLPSDQDRLTSNVWITRHTSSGLFNAKSEGFYTHSLSPVGTEWAYGTLANYSSLPYHNWEDWFGGPAGGGPHSTIGRDAVLHLIPDDVYLSVRFISLGDHGIGGFSYLRSTPSVPEPSASVLILIGLILAGSVWRRRLRKPSSFRFTR